MTTIETEKRISSNSPEQLFAFLTDMNNFEKLMPEGKIEKWESSDDQCEFTIKGMARIGLKKESVEAPSKINISSFGKVPFTFTLDINIKELADQQTEVSMVFNGDINPFMKMMVEKPLRNFFDFLVKKATEITI
ncbi:MAG: SRPBCC family protein [Flavobacteriales bacterium]|nr:SRPBCC family protein [Flavobacteriales bacterium]